MNSINKRKAALMQSTAMLIFGTTGIFRRFVPVASSLLAFFRGLLGAVFIAVYRAIFRSRYRSDGLSRRQLGWAIMTGAVMGINWLMLFEAFRYTTVAVATLCNYMQPTIIILLSPVFFHEKLTLRKLVCAVVAILGMILVSGVITGDALPDTNIKGILFGLGSAVFYSSVAIMNKLRPDGDVFKKSQIQLISASFFILPYALLSGGFEDIGLFDLKGIICLLLIGLLNTGISYVLYFSSIPHLNAQTIAVFSYIDPISALFLSSLLLSETLNLSCVAGAVMILSAAAIAEAEN